MTVAQAQVWDSVLGEAAARTKLPKASPSCRAISLAGGPRAGLVWEAAKFRNCGSFKAPTTPGTDQGFDKKVEVLTFK